MISQPTPAAEKSPFDELTTKYGVKLVYCPFIEVKGVELHDFKTQKIDISSHTAVIITNRSAVDHFFRICKEIRYEVPESMKYFCTSESIANYLQKYIVYRKRRIFFGNSSFDSILEDIKKHKKENYLVPLTSPHSGSIPNLLTKSKIKHTVAILSNIVSADMSDIDPNSFDIVVIYTPADITSLKENYREIDQDFKLALFGAGAAKAAKDLGIRIDIMVPTPEFPSMVMALDKFIETANAGEDLSSFAPASED